MFSHRSISLDLCLLVLIHGQTLLCFHRGMLRLCKPNHGSVPMFPGCAALCTYQYSSELCAIFSYEIAHVIGPTSSQTGIISVCNCVLIYRWAGGSGLWGLFSLEELHFGNTCVRARVEKGLAASWDDGILLRQRHTWGLSRACVLWPYGRAFKSIIICLLWLCNFLFPFVHSFSDMLSLPPSLLTERAKNTIQFPTFCCWVGCLKRENFPWMMPEKNLYLPRFFV